MSARPQGSPPELRLAVQRRPWLWIGVGGVCLWVIAGVSYAVTDNPNVLPALIITGSFLVPVVLVASLYQPINRELSTPCPRGSAVAPGGSSLAATVTVAFVTAGLLGVPLAALAEAWLPAGQRLWTVPVVAVVEEGIKLAILVAVASWVVRGSCWAHHPAGTATRLGLLLGAAVGLGFAACESAGFAYSQLAATHSEADLVRTELTRGLLTPLGHGVWTALVGAAILGAAWGYQHLRLTWRVVGWVAIAVGLHMAWDWSTVVATVAACTDASADCSLADINAAIAPASTSTVNALYDNTAIAWLIVIGVIGVGLAMRTWRQSAPRTSG